jgi:hypothetical protein
MKPSLEEWLASRPECPDCGEKLHRFAYCPGRSRIRPEAMQDPTQTENEGVTMSNAVVTKQGQPSAPGEVVDTSKAKVVPPSSEVKAEDGKRAGVPDLKKALETGKLEVAVRKPAAKEPKAKEPKAKAAKGKSSKAPAKPRSTGNGSGPATRITESWSGKGGKEVEVGSVVKTPTGATLKILGRWSKRKGEQIIPFVTGRIEALLPASATVSAKGKGKGDRMNVAAADCTVVKAPAVKK